MMTVGAKSMIEPIVHHDKADEECAEVLTKSHGEKWPYRIRLAPSAKDLIKLWLTEEE